MSKYLTVQIEQLKLKYSEVVKMYPNEKDLIDAALKEDGMDHLIEKAE